MKETGIMIFKKEWGPITIQTVTFTKVNGIMESQMDKGITFTKVEKQYIKETGKMEKNKVLDSLLLRIIMVILVNGKTTKNKEKDVISTQTVKNMTANGLGIKNLETVPISTKMGTFTLEDGKMTEGQVMEK